MRWDISLALNMTGLFLYVILNGVKDPTEELTVHILFTLVVGYFACAQYDGTFLYVILNGVKDPTEELPGIYFSLWLWDISLALNMTGLFLLVIASMPSK